MSTAPSPRLGTQGVVAAAGVVAAITLAARAVGVARWVAFSHAVGATCVGDVYATVNQIPNVLFEVAAGGALAAVAVPLIARHLRRGDEDRADRTASALLGWTLLVLVALTVVVLLLAGPLSQLLLGSADADRGCDPADAEAAGRTMLLLFAPQIVLYGIGIVLTGVLQAHRRFAAAALAPLLSSLVVIAVYLVFGASYDATAPVGTLPGEALLLLAGGTTLGVAALSLPLLVPVARLGARWRPTLRFPDGSGRQAGALALAGVVAVGAQQLFTVVVLLLATRSGVAGVAVWNYAQTVYLLPYAVLVVPLATAAFPRLAEVSTSSVRTLRRTGTAVVVAAVAGAAALVAARREVGDVFLLLDRGRDTVGRVTLEALPATLGWLAPGLVGFGLLALFSRALYAAGRARAAAVGAALGWVVAGVLPALAVATGAASTIGEILLALAVGSSIGMTCAGVATTVQVRHAWGPEATRGLVRAVGAALAGAVVGVGLAWLLPLQADTMAGALALGTGRGLIALGGVAAAVAALDRESWGAIRRVRTDRQGAGSESGVGD